MPLHYITHAVTFAIIATLVRKYFEVRLQYQDLLANCQISQAAPMSKDGAVDTTSEEWKGRVSNDGRFITSPFLDQELLFHGSSVWCRGTNQSNRMCEFKNLCYHPNKDVFLFFHSSENLMENIPLNRFDPAFLEMSSVANHTALYFNYVDMAVGNLLEFDIHWTQLPSLIIKRFKPDNLMHVLHDDILPVYYTLRLLNLNGNHSEKFRVQLVFQDGWGYSPFLRLYEVLSFHKFILKSDLRELSGLICFKQAFVGLSKSTVWYDYGFWTPQGPLPQYQTKFGAISQAVKYIRKHLGISLACTTSAYLVLVSRKSNRLILNENELSLKLAQNTGLRVVHVSEEQNSVDEMITIVSSSRGLIGMHGSLLTLSMFLPAGSILVELYPYAVNPKHYTPYKTFALLPGSSIWYSSWQNMDKANTRPHPDRPPEFGGIHHLPIAEQEVIQSQSEVPPHLCCTNPSWLYHIYQDTKADIPHVISLVKSALSESKNSRISEVAMLRLAPSDVENVQCTTVKDKLMIILSWDLPWNLKFVSSENIDVKYEVWIQELNSSTYFAFMVYGQTLTVRNGLEANNEYLVWIRCILSDVKTGSFGNSIVCST